MSSRTLRSMLAEANAVIDTISVQDALPLTADPSVLLVDVREGAERAASGTIAGSVHVPRGFLEFIADPAGPMHNARLAQAKRLVLFCASGGRSTLAAKTLQDMGYGGVAHIAGGFAAWKEAHGAVQPVAPAGAAWSLRRADRAEATPIKRLVDRAYAASPARRTGTLASANVERHIEAFTVWVAEEGERLVGALVMHPQPGQMVVTELAVDPDARGRGIAKALLATAEQEARARELGAVCMLTEPQDREARAYLTRVGWREEESENPARMTTTMRKVFAAAGSAK